MEILKAAILGLIQGITEFLPISSSGHLVLLKNLLGISTAGLTAEVYLHFSSLAAILLVMRNEIINLIRDIVRPPHEKFRFGIIIIIGCIPAALAGLIFKGFFEKYFSNPKYLWLFFLITSVLLLSTIRVKNFLKINISVLDALIIGFSQIAALFPGISRSGTTISVALLLGIRGLESFHFSFYMAIILIAGASSVELIQEGIQNITIPIAIGMAASFLSSIVAMKILLRILIINRFWVFGLYCLGISIISFFISL